MPLTIRNITTIGLDCKLVEHFHKPRLEDRGTIAHITRYITSFCTHYWRLRDSELALNATSVERDEKNFHIEPFSAHESDIPPPSAEEIIRMTFEAEGQRYCVDLPFHSEGSAALKPLDARKHDFTAIYSREHAHLAIFLTSRLEAWMESLRDETPLTGLSLPGTHNSPTCHRALPSVRCQAATPQEQLNNGVRFFDLRVQIERPSDPTHDGLILVHSAFPISFTGTKYFRELLREIREFLDANPSETLLMSLKREGTGDGTDQQLSQLLRRHYVGDIDQWYTCPRIPTLGEARGKIVLIRRFYIDDELRKEWNGQGWGINAETWADNTPHALTPDGNLCIQDFYEVLEAREIGQKIQYSTEQLDRSAATTTPLPSMQAQTLGEKQPLFFNFLTASNFWRPGCWPEGIAAKLNPAIVDHLCRRHNKSEAGDRIGDGTTGIVVTDWVGNKGDWDLVGSPTCFSFAEITVL
jgi:1-phosphatidylinositol phosphodiesterase